MTDTPEGAVSVVKPTCSDPGDTALAGQGTEETGSDRPAAPIFTKEHLRRAVEHAKAHGKEIDFVLLSERAAREYCKVMEVEYAPVNGKQLVGGVLLHIINPRENPFT